MTDIYNRLQLPPAPPADREWKIGKVEVVEKWDSKGHCDLYVNGEFHSSYHWYDRPPFVEVKIDI